MNFDQRRIVHRRTIGLRCERVEPAQCRCVRIEEQVTGQRHRSGFPDNLIPVRSLSGVNQLKIGEKLPVGRQTALSACQHVPSAPAIRKGLNSEKRGQGYSDFNKFVFQFDHRFGASCCFLFFERKICPEMYHIFSSLQGKGESPLMEKFPASGTGKGKKRTPRSGRSAEFPVRSESDDRILICRMRVRRNRARR